MCDDGPDLADMAVLLSIIKVITTGFIICLALIIFADWLTKDAYEMEAFIEGVNATTNDNRYRPGKLHDRYEEGYAKTHSKAE